MAYSCDTDTHSSENSTNILNEDEREAQGYFNIISIVVAFFCDRPRMAEENRK